MDREYGSEEVREAGRSIRRNQHPKYRRGVHCDFRWDRFGLYHARFRILVVQVPERFEDRRREAVRSGKNHEDPVDERKRRFGLPAPAIVPEHFPSKVLEFRCIL